MASVKVKYVVQSCPKCGKKLLELPSGTKIIGSPLITCKKCDATYRTDLRVEWYKSEHRWAVVIMPLVIPVGMLLAGIIFGYPSVGIGAAFVALIFSLLISGADLFRMLQSIKRMKDREYLKKLLVFGVISPEEYLKLSSKETDK